MSEPRDEQRAHDEDERRENHGREGRIQHRQPRVARYVQANPELSVALSALLTFVATVFGSKAVNSHEVPGASSVQIETVLKEVASLTVKVDGLAGDVRSIREADLVGRMRDMEKFATQFATQQAAYTAELAERRRDWSEWRKGVDSKLFEWKGK